MGRHSGHITFNVGVACAAEQVLSFENFSAEDEQEKLQQLAGEIKAAQANRHASYIIVIAENLWTGGATKLAEQLKSTAYIDGKQVDYLRANYVLRALEIPAGKHRIEFKFEPTIVKTGSTISLASSLLLLLLVGGGLFFTFRRNTEDSPE